MITKALNDFATKVRAYSDYLLHVQIKAYEQTLALTNSTRQMQAEIERLKILKAEAERRKQKMH